MTVGHYILSHLVAFFFLGGVPELPVKQLPTTVVAAPGTVTAQNGHRTNKRSGQKAKRAQRKATRKAQAPALAKRRAKVKQRIRALRAWKLTEALDLDGKTAARLFPAINSFDDRFTAAMRSAGKLRRQLRKELAKAKPDAAVLNRMINGTVKDQKTMWRLQEQRFAAVRKVLTPAQAAKIMMVLPEIDRNIGRQIRRAMKQRRGGKGGPGRRGSVISPFDQRSGPKGKQGKRRRGPPPDFIDPF